MSDRPIIALDVHGVVFNNPLPAFIDEIGEATGAGIPAIRQRWRSELRVAFWEGHLGEDEMWARLAPGCDARKLRRDLEDRYTLGPFGAFVEHHPGPIWLLSNHRTDWLMARLDRFGLTDRFERIYVSDTIGAAKPSDRAFAVLAREADLHYYDDSDHNVAAARKLGITASVVTGSDTPIPVSGNGELNRNQR